MALSEQKILKSVNVLPAAQAIEVQWSNQILRNDVVISETYSRCAYGADQKEQFLSDVPNGQPYIDAVGWV